MRSECKKCTIKKNVRYQREHESWKYRFVDNEEKKTYMSDYYAKNKEKFAEYRAKFREKHPDYFKMYHRDRKDAKRGKSEAEANNSSASGLDKQFRRSYYDSF